MAEQTPQSIFKGRVVADDGSPLAGVSVNIKSETSLSDIVATASETNVSNVAETTIPTKINQSITDLHTGVEPSTSQCEPLRQEPLRLNKAHLLASLSTTGKEREASSH